MIAIIDYRMGNLRSVQKAFLKAGGRAIVTSDENKVRRADKVVLPGVGAFGDGMKELRRLGMAGVIKDGIKDGRPFLGICLGLQLLFDSSQEAPGAKGLGVLMGKVKKFSFNYRLSTIDYRLKIPHMGWNQIGKSPSTEHQSPAQCALLKNIPDGSYVYFVHSYYVVPADKGIIAATTDYGVKFASAVCRDNIYGVQFHPEKSQDVGLRILRSFVKL